LEMAAIVFWAQTSYIPWPQLALSAGLMLDTLGLHDIHCLLQLLGLSGGQGSMMVGRMPRRAMLPYSTVLLVKVWDPFKPRFWSFWGILMARLKHELLQHQGFSTSFAYWWVQIFLFFKPGAEVEGMMIPKDFHILEGGGSTTNRDMGVRAGVLRAEVFFAWRSLDGTARDASLYWLLRWIWVEKTYSKHLYIKATNPPESFRF
jgi:hypothetical protein